jgi:alkanesulfonate monooxygenase SsuD/methylene tetrahydromethanopterin reductase-like flavin-dependent oxidoreductase (luciferase family)
VPIWIGGSSHAALERTARSGDGWLPSQITPEEIGRYVPWIQERSNNLGRQIPKDHYGALLRCYIVEKGNVPLEKIRPYLLSRRSDLDSNEVHLLGTPDQVAARLEEFIDAGATKFVFSPACGIEEVADQMGLQSELIVKHFHSKYAN